MPATLPQIQARLEQSQALRDELAETAQDLQIDALAGGTAISTATQQSIQARLNGYHREVELLMKIERDLVANGKAAENDLSVLSRFDASQAGSAAMTPSLSHGAHLAPREAPRNEASATPLPASGDVFLFSLRTKS